VGHGLAGVAARVVAVVLVRGLPARLVGLLLVLVVLVLVVLLVAALALGGEEPRDRVGRDVGLLQTREEADGADAALRRGRGKRGVRAGKR
jgi:hypothetical protein